MHTRMQCFMERGLAVRLCWSPGPADPAACARHGASKTSGNEMAPAAKLYADNKIQAQLQTQAAVRAATAHLHNALGMLL